MDSILVVLAIIPCIFVVKWWIEELVSPCKIYKDAFMFRADDMILSIGLWAFHLLPIISGVALICQH